MVFLANCDAFYSLISSDLTRMTDSERDQIDQDAQIFMRTCSEAIKQLRHEGWSCAWSVATLYRHLVNARNEPSIFLFVPLAEKQVTSAQLKEHRVVVLDLSETYLKSKFVSVARALWIRSANITAQ